MKNFYNFQAFSAAIADHALYGSSVISENLYMINEVVDMEMHSALWLYMTP